MTTLANRNLLIWFLFWCVFLPLVIITGIAVDVWLIRTQPTGSSISWSTEQVWYQYPAVAFWTGFVVGTVITGLSTHWGGFGLMSPTKAAEFDRLKARVAELEVESRATLVAIKPLIAEDQGETRPPVV